MIKVMLSVLLLGSSFFALPAAAQSDGFEARTLTPAIWVDPDGCEYWVLDLGVEGMMSPHLDRAGNPVCPGPANICENMSGDSLFAVSQATLTESAAGAVTQFFQQAMNDGTNAFVVVGHTDATGSEASNMALSIARANSVANIAKALGVSVRAEGRGEANPIASNGSENGRSQNRRVEIMCER